MFTYLYAELSQTLSWVVLCHVILQMAFLYPAETPRTPETRGYGDWYPNELRGSFWVRFRKQVASGVLKVRPQMISLSPERVGFFSVLWMGVQLLDENFQPHEAI